MQITSEYSLGPFFFLASCSCRTRRLRTPATLATRSLGCCVHLNVNTLSNVRPCRIACPPRPLPPSPPLAVKTLTGRKAQFNFDDTDTVAVVKSQLQEKEGIQSDQIRLIYSGKQMADDKTLADYNVKAGSTIHMVLQLRGGN